MPSLSTTGGWTFTNIGPLTTTFTPAATCTNDIYVAQTSPDFFLDAPVDCSAYEADIAGCYPTRTITTTGAPTSFSKNTPWVVSYQSPGIYCPSGWTTAGVAAHGSNKTMSSSGVMTMTDGGYEQYEIPAVMLAGILDPSETLALCCPSGMKGDLGFEGCWSSITSSTPTTACELYVASDDLVPFTKTFTYGTTTVTQDYQVEVGIDYTSTSTMTFTETSSDSALAVVSAVAIVTLVHKRSDIEAATNAAGRLDVADTGLHGLGAAIIFQ